MRKINISFPVLSWGTATIEVEDDANDEDVLADLMDGIIDFPSYNIEFSLPVPDLRNWKDYTYGSEIPSELEIEE